MLHSLTLHIHDRLHQSLEVVLFPRLLEYSQAAYRKFNTWNGVEYVFSSSMKSLSWPNMSSQNWMLDCISIKIVTMYLEGIALCSVGTSDNSSEAMIMNSCIPGIHTSFFRISWSESSFLTMNINSRAIQSLQNCWNDSGEVNWLKKIETQSSRESWQGLTSTFKKSSTPMLTGLMPTQETKSTMLCICRGVLITRYAYSSISRQQHITTRSYYCHWGWFPDFHEEQVIFVRGN